MYCGCMIEQALPWVWLVVFVGVCARLVATRRAPVDAPVWPSVAVATAVGGITGLLGGSPVVQVVVVVVIAVGMTLLFLHWRRLLYENRLPPGVGGNRLVDMVGEVTAPVSPRPSPPQPDGRDRAPGHVTVGGEDWRAVSSDDNRHEVGSPIRVVAVRGTTLVVATSPRGHATPRPAGATPDRATPSHPSPSPTTGAS